MKKIFIFLIFILIPKQSFAYNLWESSSFWCSGDPINWENDQTFYTRGMGTSSSSCNEVGASDLNDVKCAAKSWNDLPLTFDFTIQPTSQNYLTLDNGQNEIIVTDDYEYDDEIIAYAIPQTSCSISGDATFDEVDIVINPESVVLNGATSQHGITDPSFRYVLIHELGHSLGLAHENENLSAMNSKAKLFNFYRGSALSLGTLPHPDDVYGATRLYDNHNLFWDIGLINVRWQLGTEDDDENGQTDLDFLHSFHLDTNTFCRGDLITSNITYVNRGNTSSTKISMKFSSNSWISEEDFTSNDYTITLPYYSKGVLGSPFTIPYNIPSGTYFVGACIRYNNSNIDVYPSNNCINISTSLNGQLQGNDGTITINCGAYQP